MTPSANVARVRGSVTQRRAGSRRAPVTRAPGAANAGLPSASENARALSNRSAGSFSSAFAERGRHVRRDRSCAARSTGRTRLGDDLHDDLLRRGAHVRRLAGEHLVEHARQAVDVRARGDVLVGRRLLRATCSAACPATGRSRSCGRRPRRVTASAMPKSITIARPSCSRMFSGLMSRWITPWRCA